MPRRRRNEKKEDDVTGLTKELSQLMLNEKNFMVKLVNDDIDIDLDTIKDIVDQFFKISKTCDKLTSCTLAALIMHRIGELIFTKKCLKFAPVAPVIGFSELGIVVDSLAASAQSYYGDLTAGSFISQMTSKAMKMKKKKSP